MNEEPRLRSLRDAPPPPLQAVRARMRRRRLLRVAGTATSAALAAGLLLALLPQAGRETWRERGLGLAPLVELAAVAEGSGKDPRLLRPGGEIGPEERVIFLVRTSEPGSARLVERGPAGERRVWPASGAWSIEAGEHAPGGEHPLSWRPDGGPGAYRYEVAVCPEPSEGDCGRASLELVWSPSP